MAAIKACLSIECVDNAEGVPGVVVYDDKTFAIPSEQNTMTASRDEQGPYSSVRPFQVANYENEDPAIYCRTSRDGQ